MSKFKQLMPDAINAYTSSASNTPPIHPDVMQHLVEFLRRGLNGSGCRILRVFGESAPRWEGSDLKILDRDVDSMVATGFLTRGDSIALSQHAIRSLAPELGDYLPRLENVVASALSMVPSIIQRTYVPGKGRLILLLGENAAGKSLVRRRFSDAVHAGRSGSWDRPAVSRGTHPVAEQMVVSMQARVQNPMIYGTEERFSTGQNSCRTFGLALDAASKRCHSCMLLLDEPDIGLSSGASRGMGIALRNFLDANHPMVFGTLLASHSPAMVQELVQVAPHYLYVGSNAPPSVQEWIERQVNPEPIMPEDLLENARQMSQALRDVL